MIIGSLDETPKLVNWGQPALVVTTGVCTSSRRGNKMPRSSTRSTMGRQNESLIAMHFLTCHDLIPVLVQEYDYLHNRGQ